MRKNYFRVLINISVLLTGSGIIFSACQKVIKVDLNSAAPQIVVEGNVSDQSGHNIVKLSQTVNFDQSNTFPPVSGALVSISDGMISETLTMISPGVYQTSTLQGVLGKTYTLQVSNAGNDYTAVSVMPLPVPIDTVTVGKSSFGKRIILNMKFQDPAGIANYYRVVEIVNGDTINKIFTHSDQYQDGELLSMNISETEVDLKSGDIAVVFLQSIDKPVYDYLNALNQIINGGGQSAAPANPPSNISNSALGYFSAHSVTSKAVVVP